MNENEIIRLVLPRIIEGSAVFGAIKKDIDDFLKKSKAGEWLSLSQVSTIHEILMQENKDEHKRRLNEYRERQLKRESEQDKWRREVNINGKQTTAIDHFSEMVTDLLERHYATIQEKVEDKLRIPIDRATHGPTMQQTLIKIFDHIFVTTMRIVKGEKEDKECLKN